MGKLADVFEKRAESNKNTADRYYAQAKQGEGNQNYGKAQKWYNEAERNKAKAEEMRKQNK